MKEGTTFIYALVDPTTEEVRYIGTSVNPKHRLAVHCDYTKQRTSAKSKWIHTLAQLGRKPVMLILEEVDIGAGDEAEAKWIAHYRAQGSQLVNGNDGGKGYNMRTHKLEPHVYGNDRPTINGVLTKMFHVKQ